MMRSRIRHQQQLLAIATALVLFASGCGGGKKTAPLSIATSTLPDGEVGTPYNLTLSTTGGKAPITWTLVTGALPAGLTLSPSGSINGTPTTAEIANFTLQAADSAKTVQTATRAYSLNVTDPLRFDSSSLPNGVRNSAYNQTVSVSGGIAPYTWALTAGGLPPGISLNAADGALSGTPTASGNFIFTIQVTDSDNPIQTISREFTLTISSSGGVAITTTSLPPTTNSSTGQFLSYEVVLESVGGTDPLTWSLAAGSGPLPAGLSLSAAGLISGQATGTAGTSTFTVKVVDGLSQTDERVLSITVSASLGRNETVATATAISNGSFSASISPIDDPAQGTGPFPDVDVYRVDVTPGSVVSFEVFAKRLIPSRHLDSLMEIVRGDGTRLTTCRNQGLTDGISNPIVTDPTPNAFDDTCLNDDINPGVIQDSMLELQVPAGVSQVFIRILDLGNMARPDKRYQLVVSGVN